MFNLEQKIGSLQCPEHHKKIYSLYLGKDDVGIQRIKCRQCDQNGFEFSIEQIDLFIQSIFKHHPTHHYNNQVMQSKINDFNALMQSLQEQLNQLSMYFEQRCQMLGNSLQQSFLKLSNKTQWKMTDLSQVAEMLSYNIDITGHHNLKLKPQTINQEVLNELDQIIKSIKGIYTQIPKFDKPKLEIQQIKIKKLFRYKEFQEFNEQKHRIVDVAIHPKKNCFLSGSDGPINNLIQWKYLNDQWIEHSNYKHFNDGIFALKYNPNSEYLAIGGVQEIIICAVKEENIIVQQRIKATSTQSQHINSIDWMNDEIIVAGWSCGMVVVLQKQKSEWREIQTVKRHVGCINSVTTHQNLQYIASGGQDSTINIWQLNQIECKFVQSLMDHKKNVWSVIFNQQTNQLISSSDDRSIKIYNQNNEGHYKCIQTLYDHDDSVYMVNFSPKYTIMMSCGQDQKLRLWNYDDQQGQWINYQILNQDRDLTPIGVYITQSEEFLILSLLGTNINKLKVYKLEV